MLTGLRQEMECHTSFLVEQSIEWERERLDCPIRWWSMLETNSFHYWSDYHRRRTWVSNGTWISIVLHSSRSSTFVVSMVSVPDLRCTVDYWRIRVGGSPERLPTPSLFETKCIDISSMRTFLSLSFDLVRTHQRDVIFILFFTQTAKWTREQDRSATFHSTHAECLPFLSCAELLPLPRWTTRRVGSIEFDRVESILLRLPLRFPTRPEQRKRFALFLTLESTLECRLIHRD